MAKSCGTERFERVFTGTVISAAEVGDTDKRLEVVPDEVFVGDSTQVVAMTNQACLHEDVQVGQKWLFYLYRDPKNGSLIISYDGPSKLVSEAQDDLSMLRDLNHLQDTGILVGTIDIVEETSTAAPVRSAYRKVVGSLDNSRIIAKNTASGSNI